MFALQGKAITKRARVDAAIDAMRLAGYVGPDRFSRKTMEAKTEDLLSLPRVQANIAAEIKSAFDAQAFNVDKCAEVIAEIAMDKTKPAGERLRAVDMYVRMSFGYVPSSSVSLHKHQSEKADKWFDRDVFSGKAEIEMDEPKNVTPK